MEILDVHKQNILLDLIERGAYEPALELLKGDNFISDDEINKSLISACQCGYTGIVHMLIEHGANVNYRDANGNLPLLISVENGFTDIVQFLLHNKADVSVSNYEGYSALILSIHSSGSTEITKSLLKQEGININHQNQDGDTAIMKAAKVKNIDALKILLDEYCNADATKTSTSFCEPIGGCKTRENTPCTVADTVSQWTILRNTINFQGENVYQIAERCGIGNIFQLLQTNVNTNISPLESAIRARDTKSFLAFLDCDFISAAANKKKHLDEALQQIFQTCSHKDIIDFSENEIAMIKGLLEHGADVNTAWFTRTPLFNREQSGQYIFNKESTSLHSGQISLYWNASVYPIQIAAKSGCYQVLELLLSFQAEIKMYGFQNSPLNIALAHGHTECAKLLIQHGANIDFIHALELAVDQQEPQYVKSLIVTYKNEIIKHSRRCSDIDGILIMSVRKGSLEIIGQVLDLGANINGVMGSGTCPIAESRNWEVAKFLIDRGADVKSVKCIMQVRCHSPLIKLLKRRDCKDNSVVEVIQVMLENGASVDDRTCDSFTPLMLVAVKEGSTSVLQLLLDHGAELGEVDKAGNTALMHAAGAGCFQNVSFLLQVARDRKDSINFQNGVGLTALMFAVRFRCGNPTVVKELIDQGADVNIEDSKGNTALLHLPLISGQHEEEIVRSLIQAGCDVNWQNNEGLSPLMLAAQNCLKNRMCLLLDMGAEINAVSRKDKTKTALSHLVYKSYHKRDYFKSLACLLDRGAHASYIKATALHKMILVDQTLVVAKLIQCGLGPASVLVNCAYSSSYRPNTVGRAYRFSSDDRTETMEYHSPLSAALCAGNSILACFFVQNLFLTHYDIYSLRHNRLLRQHLEKHTSHQKCLEILNEISTQPMSLFKLSFVAVTTAVGTSPGRENRVKELPLPGLIKTKLLFKG